MSLLGGEDQGGQAAGVTPVRSAAPDDDRRVALEGRKLDQLIPDSPDEIAFGQLHAPIPTFRSSPYAGSSSRILTDPTGESKESAVWSAFPRLSVLPVQSIRGIREDCSCPSRSVGDDEESNWLPAPDGRFVLIMRLYWPDDGEPLILNGT